MRFFVYIDILYISIYIIYLDILCYYAMQANVLDVSQLFERRGSG